MKTTKKAGFLLVMFLLISLLAVTSLIAGDQQSNNKKIEIIFSHDLHSHLEPFMAKVDTGEEEVGGFARIKSFIDQKSKEAEDLLVIDAGDFTMGPLYQSICVDNASELRLMGSMGVVATTLGNHEFDYGMEGLTRMFQSAIDSGDVLPELLICNIDWEKSLQGENAEVNKKFKDVLEAYGAKKYTIVERNGMRIAMTGVFGKDSLVYSPECTLSFIDPIEAVKETVKEIKANEKVDMIICLSHSGTSSDIKKSEDEQLAIKVPELDLIISGHSHTRIDAPIIYGDTAIVSCECYGKYSGNLVLEEKGARWQIADYQLVKMDVTISEDKKMQEKIQLMALFRLCQKMKRKAY